jgi:A/G-specific adenine glycosylase
MDQAWLKVFMVALSHAESQPKPDASMLLAWYDRHARILPWRSLPGNQADPYHVWLSEIMLQQTTVQAVKPYFEKFLLRWPRVEMLAAADAEDIMRMWAGLGYYSRARNLHACAKEIVGRFAGRFPRDETSLISLPGVGQYTAAAIGAIAFGERAVVVDGNVERVVARLHRLDVPMPAAKARIKQLTDVLTPDARPGDFAQAMMDLGATICTPRSPACAICPFHDVCAARQAGDPQAYPVKAPARDKPTRYGVAYVVTRRDGALLVRTREAKGLLGGMVEVPGSEWAQDQELAQPASEPMALRWTEYKGPVRHVFTHFPLELKVYSAIVANETAAPPGMRWLSANAISEEAFPTLFRKVLKAAGI